eukprot:COSAG01_NODE_5729_length_4071_cov_9.539023_2_plen_39_part_00
MQAGALGLLLLNRDESPWRPAGHRWPDGGEDRGAVRPL